MATITLDGVEYSTRKRTNKVVSTTSELVKKRQSLAVEYMRRVTEVQRISGLASVGGLGEDDPDNMAMASADLARIERDQDVLTMDLAPLVLVDPDGKPPTKKLLDEHAELGELDDVVKVAIGELPEPTPNPTSDPPDAA